MEHSGMGCGALLAEAALAVALTTATWSIASPLPSAGTAHSPAWREDELLVVAAVQEVLAEAVPFAAAQLAATAALNLPVGLYLNGTDWTHHCGAWMATGPEKWTSGGTAGRNTAALHDDGR